MESSVDKGDVGVSEESAKEAEQLKNTANELFKEKKYEAAVEYYTRAIDVNPLVAAYYGNRSFSYLKSEFYGSALNDASKALEVDRKYVKGYYRRASANMSLGKFRDALKDFEAVKRAKPHDKDALNKYNECNKIVRQIAFEKAIAVEAASKKKASETIDLDTIAVPDSYKGPRLESDDITNNALITADFMKEMVEWFRDQKKLHNKYAYMIILDALKLLQTLPSLVDITIPECNKFTVCGDIHGQYYDLINIFKINGVPSQDNPYLFNGDFVDRGSFSVEVILTLFGFRILYPDHFHMARGNHESDNLNKMYGFEGEVKSKYSNKMMDLFSEVFNWLPLAHCIEGKIMVTHGGLLSDDGVSLDDIRMLRRDLQPPEQGTMCELLWSDPQDMYGRSSSKRGVGVQFGPDVTQKFLRANNLDLIIRSHEVKQEGYEVSHDGKCITVFSAPNYCDQMGNKGAFITLNKSLQPTFTSFEAVPHPNIKPMQYANPLFGSLT